MHGLKPHTIQAIQNVFAKYPNIEKSILYGSRAKGNYRNGSDIDLTLVGKNLTLSEQFSIETELDDLLLPYKIDLSIYHKIENQDLTDHIDRVGITFYKNDNAFAKAENDKEWGEIRLSSIIDIIGGGTPKTKVKEYWNGNIPWLSVVDFNSGRKYVSTTEKTITEKGLKESSTKLLYKGDIIISARGTVGALAMLSSPMAFNQSCYGIRAKEEHTTNDYMFYLLKDTVSNLLQISHGGVFDTITKQTFDEVKINLPTLPEQQAIAEVLSSLDAKIDLLHRQNKTLEALAETLFRQWFDDKEFDGTVKDLVNVQNGYAFKSKDFKDFGVNKVIKIKNISGNKVDISAADFISEEVASKTNEKFKISTGDILFAMTGAEIGKMGIVETNTQNLWLNQRVGLLNEKYKGAKYLAYLCLQSDFGQDYIEHAATGSAQPNISSTGIEACPFPKLTKNQIIEYSNSISPFYDKVIFNLGEIKTLEKTRDTLLPKLMSGEVRVNIN